MQLNPFLNGENENFGKTLAIFYLRTVPLKYGTFRALIDLRTVPF